MCFVLVSPIFWPANKSSKVGRYINPLLTSKQANSEGDELKNHKARLDRGTVFTVSSIRGRAQTLFKSKPRRLGERRAADKCLIPSVCAAFRSLKSGGTCAEVRKPKRRLLHTNRFSQVSAICSVFKWTLSAELLYMCPYTGLFSGGWTSY